MIWNINKPEILNPFSLPTVHRYNRGMRWKPINKKYSKNCVAHHINNSFVVYIPKELHENSIHNNRILHRKQVKKKIREINLKLYIKICFYNFLYKFELVFKR